MRKLIFLLFLLILVGCKPDDSKTPTVLSDKLTGETKEFEIVARTWSFEPDTIRVNRGDKVVMKIRSVDVSHGISIPEFNINEQLNPGKEVRIEFIAKKSGTFSFTCSVYCGSGHGSMSGTLIVN